MPAKRLPYPFVEPDPARQTHLEIEDTAAQCALDWGCASDKTLDEVCKNAGVDVEYSRRPNEILLEVPLQGQPVIWLPRAGRKRDDRVLISTALGHWALHIENTRKAHPGCGVQALYEPESDEALQEAKVFGMALLMPKEKFTEAWRLGRSQEASDRFDVPTEITYLRATSLDLGDAL